MSVWDEYRGLLDELDGLAALEASGIDQAEASYQQESRHLQNELAGAERQHRELESRNKQLQAGIRSLARSLGIAVPPGASASLLTKTQLNDAMRSAEYDLEQMRRSLAFVEAQRSPAQVASEPTSPAPPEPQAPADPVVIPGNRNRTAVATSVIAIVVVLILLGVLLAL